MAMYFSKFCFCIWIKWFRKRLSWVDWNNELSDGDLGSLEDLIELSREDLVELSREGVDDSIEEPGLNPRVRAARTFAYGDREELADIIGVVISCGRVLVDGSLETER